MPKKFFNETAIKGMPFLLLNRAISVVRVPPPVP